MNILSRKVDWVTALILVSIIISILIFVFLMCLDLPTRSFFARYSDSAIVDYRKQFPAKSEASEIAKTVFLEKIKQSKQRTDDINTNFKLQIVFLFTGAALIYFKRKETYTVPVLGIELHRSFIILLIPFSLIWTQFRFGFLLDNAIGQRAVIYLLANEIQPHANADSFTSDESRLFSVHSLADDVDFIDGWLVASGAESRQLVSIRNTDELSRAVVCVILTLYMTIVGASHAMCIALIHESTKSSTWYIRKPAIVFAIFFCILFIAIHLTFRLSGGNKTWSQLPVLISWLFFQCAFTLRLLPKSTE